MLNSNSLRILPIRAVLNTFPVPDYGDTLILSDEDYKYVSCWEPYRWIEWRDAKHNLSESHSAYLEQEYKDHSDLVEKYEAYYSAFLNLKIFPALQEVVLHFTPRFLAEERTGYYELVKMPVDSHSLSLAALLCKYEAR